MWSKRKKKRKERTKTNTAKKKKGKIRRNNSAKVLYKKNILEEKKNNIIERKRQKCAKESIAFIILRTFKIEGITLCCFCMYIHNNTALVNNKNQQEENKIM